MKEIRFVDVGEGITEGHVRKWLFKDGDQVKEDAPVAQVETDKAVVNVPAPISGTLKIAAPEGTTLHVGDLVAQIGTPEELKASPSQPQKPAQPQKAQSAQQPQPALQQQPRQPAPAPAQQTSEKAREIMATPAIRKLAHDYNIDLARITGTGPHGRILENDVRGAIHDTSLKSRPMPKFSEELEQQHGDKVVREPMSQTRKAIARNMELSWTIPRAVSMDMLDATNLYGIVTKEKANVQKMDIHLTFLPFIIKAVVEALKENPHFNASYDHETQEILVKKYYNIGLAAEAPDGLKVVVVKDADRKSVLEIAKEIQQLHKKLQEQTISIDEMRDSTFTITNIGSLGGGFLSVPMINYPEVGILGVHMLKDMPVVNDGKVAVGKVLPISISFDHRVVDGAEAVKFGNAVIKYLQDVEFLELLG
ncbi:MAG: 2-oxo acid dehydrogenase subunit E2 [Candidatus Marsarchaeota archaeon]|nr:2-oxo acid dehydrogenase subunit E2 [Candidatus Marsarchaeota archaeon]